MTQPNENASSSPRDAFRTALLSSDVPVAKRLTVKGTEVEIRNMTLKQRRRVEKESKGDGTVANVLAVIECTFIPGTDTLMFEAQDQESLMSRFSGGFVDVLALEIGMLVDAEKKKATESAKN